MQTNRISLDICAKCCQITGNFPTSFVHILHSTKYTCIDRQAAQKRYSHHTLVLKQKDTNNSAENNRVEHVFRSYKIRVRIFSGLKESKSRKIHVP